MLKVKKLDPKATLPTVAHPHEDLAYDLYALEDVMLYCHLPVKVRTGIAAQAFKVLYANTFKPLELPLGLLIRDRSSMAAKGYVTTGGVIDHGYTGEIIVLMTLSVPTTDASGALSVNSQPIKAGDKIAQMIPIEILTGSVVEVEELGESDRGAKGFGSTGK